MFTKPSYSYPALKFFTLLTSFLFFFVWPAFANSLKIPRLHIELTEPWGYFIRDSTSNHDLQAGIWVEIADKISQKSGIHFRKTLTPYARIKKNIVQGKADFSFLPGVEKKKLRAVEAGYLFSFSIIAFANRNTKVSSPDDLVGKRIGAVRGWQNSFTFGDENIITPHHAYRNYEIMINMLSHNRLDIILGNNISLFYLMEKKQYQELSSVFKFKKVPMYVLFSNKSSFKDSHPLVIKKAVEQLRQEGTFTAIIKKYTTAEINYEKE